MSEEESNVVDELTPEEQYDLAQYLRGGIGTSPVPTEQFNVHKFLHDVSVSKDTTKTGYIDETELGSPDLPVRSLKEIALFCNKIWGDKLFGEFFEARSEIITSTSLSKNAKLIELAVVSRRELGDVTKRSGKKNRGWFRKKEDKEE